MKLKAFAILCLVSLASLSAHAQYTITATLKQPSGGVPIGAKLHFELRNCGPGTPIVPSVPGAIVARVQEFKASPTTGIVTGKIYGNNQIECGGTTHSQWGVTIYSDSTTHGNESLYTINGTWDLATSTPDNAPIPPGPPVQWVARKGDTMTGPLLLPSAPPTQDTQATTKGYVDTAVIGGAGAINEALNGKVAKAGDTMSGPLVLRSAPTQDLEAANKGYVDPIFAKKADLVSGVVPSAELGTGSADSTTCLLGSGIWAPCAPGVPATATTLGPVKGTGTGLTCDTGYVANGFQSDGTLNCVVDATSGTPAALQANALGSVMGVAGSLTCDSGKVSNGFNSDGSLNCVVDQTGGGTYTLPAVQASTLGGIKGTAGSTACVSPNVVSGFAADGSINCVSPPADATSIRGTVVSALPAPTAGASQVFDSVSNQYKAQTKAVIDVRDVSGVDCTGTVDSSTALNNLFTNINSRKVVFPQDCKIRVETTLTIFGQSGWSLAGIDARPFGGSFVTPVIFGCSGSAGPILHINRSALGRISGLSITPKGASCSSSFTQSVAFDNTGGGGVSSSDLVLDGVTLTTSTAGGAIANYIGLRVYGAAGNLQGVNLNNVKIHCQNSTGSTGISLEVGTTDADALAKSIVQSCFYGVLYNGSMDITNNIFSSNGAFSTFGAGGAAIRVNTCSSGPVNVYFNEVDSGGQFINNAGDVNNGGCPYGMNIVGNVIGTGDNAAGVFPINLGTVAGPNNVIGNTVLSTPNISQYLIGTASQPATTGPKGSLNLQGNKDQIPNNDLGWINPTTPFQDGQILIGNYGTAYGTGANGRGITNGSSYSEILVPGGSHTNERQGSPFKIFRSYTNAANDDWTAQSVSDSGSSTFKLMHTGGPATSLWNAFQGTFSGLTTGQVTAPGIPGASVFGGNGSTSYSYSVVAYGATGNSVGSTVRTTAVGPATLDGTHYIQVQWVPTGGGVIQYCVWRTASGGTPSSTGKIGCTSAALFSTNSLTDNTYFLNDTGLAGDSASLPASNTSGQIISSVATGLAPFSVASTTNVPNLNASTLSGATFAAPGPIGSTTPSTAAFTNVTINGTCTGAGCSNSPLTEKGDLFTYNGSAAAALTVGAQNQCLIADPDTGANPLGIKWGACSAGSTDASSLQGKTVASTAPANLNLLGWNAAANGGAGWWEPTANEPISFITNLQSSLDAKAPLVSPALTGAPTTPTAAIGTNTTQIASTAYVQANRGVTQVKSGAIDQGEITRIAFPTASFQIVTATGTSTANPIFGTTASTFMQGNDARFELLANKGTSYPSLVGGFVPTAQLGSGTANSGTVLLGDNTWGTLPGSSPLTTLGDIYVYGSGGNTRLPRSATNGWCLVSDSTVVQYGLKWATCPGGGGAVVSVFGRTGAVIKAVGDYNISDITNGAADSAVVHNSGSESIAGVKTFSNDVSILGGLSVASFSLTGPYMITGTGLDQTCPAAGQSRQYFNTAGKLFVCENGVGPTEVAKVGAAGIGSLNGSTQTTQTFAVPGTAGTAPAWSTNTGTGVHTLNIPLASAGSVTAGLVSNADYVLFPKVTVTSATLNDVVTWDGAKWINQAPTGGGSNHNLLSATHPDTLAASPVAGDLVMANVTPKWSKLAKSATPGNVLIEGATLPQWGTVDLTTGAAVSGILTPTNGGTGNQYFKVLGPLVAHNYTFPNLDSTMMSTATVLAATQVPVFAGGDVTSAGGNLVLSIAANAVTTAKILDGNVTLAKIAGANLQGNGTKLLASTTVANGQPVLCTDANGNATTSNCLTATSGSVNVKGSPVSAANFADGTVVWTVAGSNITAAIPAATNVVAGIVSTAAQTFGGDKTFANRVITTAPIATANYFRLPSGTCATSNQVAGDLCNEGNTLKLWDGANYLTFGGIADPGTNGIVVRTAGGPVTRTITPYDSSVVITNGDGIAGNPTIRVNEANFSTVVHNTTDETIAGVKTFSDGIIMGTIGGPNIIFNRLISSSPNAPTTGTSIGLGQTDAITYGCASGCAVSSITSSATNQNLIRGNGSAGPAKVGDSKGVDFVGPVTKSGASLATRICEVHIWGTGAAGALQATDDEVASCRNKYGGTLTITSVECRADTGTTTTVTPIITGGSGTSILTGALTCGNATFAAGTVQSTPPTISADGSIDMNITVAGTAKQVIIVIGMTL